LVRAHEPFACSLPRLHTRPRTHGLTRMRAHQHNARAGPLSVVPGCSCARAAPACRFHCRLTSMEAFLFKSLFFAMKAFFRVAGASILCDA
jgi:hypothetical protein